MDHVLGLSFDPFTLPSVPLEDRATLPKIAAIYFAIQGETVLYVGKATTLRSRWYDHHRYEELRRRGGVRIAWLEVEYRRMLDGLEEMCIDKLRPEMNGQSPVKFCAVKDCHERAVVECLLYDAYHDGGGGLYDIFMEQDDTCGYLCWPHLKANEDGAQRHKEIDERTRRSITGGKTFITVGELRRLPRLLEPAGLERRYRGSYTYPYTLQNGGSGFSIYRPLDGSSL